MVGIGVLLSLVLIIVGLLAFIVVVGYVKASPNTAYIITGLRKKPKVLIGRAGFRIPFFEKKDVLHLELIDIDVKSEAEIPTADYIPIRCDGVVNVRISVDPNKLEIAARHFLNCKPEKLREMCQSVLEANMREIIGKMELTAMISDRQKFSQQVSENAVPDLAKMGIDLVSFNVQNFYDSNGVIEALGTDNAVQVTKQAAIAKANGDRDIAEKQNELDIKVSELKVQADSKKAEADAAYEIQKEEQRKTIEVTKTNADIAKQQQEVILKQKEAEVKEQALNAEIRKKADAERYEKEQTAQALLFTRQREAEAKKYEQVQEAEAKKAQADADLYAKAKEAEAVKAKGLAEAEAVKAKGLAEAEAVKAKGLAEAEATEKKAEAMAKMTEAAVLEMYFNTLPEVAKNVAEPLSKVDKITMYGDGNNTKMIKDIVNTMSQVTGGVQEATGINVNALLTGLLGGKLATANNNNNTNNENMLNPAKLNELAQSYLDSKRTTTETATPTPSEDRKETSEEKETNTKDTTEGNHEEKKL